MSGEEDLKRLPRRWQVVIRSHPPWYKRAEYFIVNGEKLENVDV